MTHTQHEPRPSMLTHFLGGIGKNGPRLNVRWKVETLPIHEPNLNQKRAGMGHSMHSKWVPWLQGTLVSMRPAIASNSKTSPSTPWSEC